MPPLVDVQDLWFRYPNAGARVGRDQNWVLRDINLQIEAGSTFGIVGESGSGKSTLVRVLSALLRNQRGNVVYDKRTLSEWTSSSNMSLFRAQNQMVFQSPASSLDPRMRIRRSLAEPVKAIERRQPDEKELEEWLSAVGLGVEVLPRYPHQLSGGQLQRIALARALSLGPKILYADEPTSALDVSVQAQVLNLLIDLRERFGLTLVMVSHDLAVISRLCEQLLVMKDGEVVESGETVKILQSPKSEYTASLIGAAEAVSLAAE